MLGWDFDPCKMSWMLSLPVATALLVLCRGENTVHEASGLSSSGYHLCYRNETRTVTFLALHQVPYTVTQPCGGWLLSKTCTVTLYRMIHQVEYKTVMEQVTRCCQGYVQVGRYCALAVNRSGEFTAKPGACPTVDGLYPGLENCESDMDCPGWQKCCQGLDRSFCSDAASPAKYTENGGYRLNVTVTIKMDYEQLISEDKGIVNHTRLLQAMVIGALHSDVSVYYLSTWPVHPYRTATSLLIEGNSTLSMYNVTTELHLLLKHIQEVSSVTVEDVDECEESALHQCSPQALCNNTLGSYQCACHQGYVDFDPSNPGTNCTADVNVATTAEFLFISGTPMNTTHTPAANTTQEPQSNSTMAPFNSTLTSTTAALSYTASVPDNSSHAQTSSAPYPTVSSTVESPLSLTTCSPDSSDSLWSANVSGTTFCVYWSRQFQMNQTYCIVLKKGSEVIQFWETNQTMMTVTGLQPGVLYNVSVKPCACGSNGTALYILVKTDAQIVDVRAHLTNIQFTADLYTSSSEAYKNLSKSFREEIYQFLSPEMKVMVESGQVRIQINGFSPGSVVVNFIVISSPSENQGISNVTTALLHSLINSTKYSVDQNNTSIDDFNECAAGENDCSQWALCSNTWASYTCTCLDGFVDNNPERGGRVCLANRTLETMTATADATTSLQVSPTTVILSPNETVSAGASSTPLVPVMPFVTPTDDLITAPATTPSTSTTIADTQTAPQTLSSSYTPPLTSITAPATAATAFVTSTTALVTTTNVPTTTAIFSAITTIASETTTKSPTTAIIVPEIISTVLESNTTATTSTFTVSSKTISAELNTTSDPPPTISLATVPLRTTTTASATTTKALTTAIIAPIITSTVLESNTTATTSTVTVSSQNISAQSTTTTDAPTTTTLATVPLRTTTTASTSTTTASASSIIHPITTSTTLITTITAPTTNATALRTATSASALGAISVQCRGAAITATIARDFLVKTNIQESALYLGLLECGVNGGNATHVQLTVAWNECSTRLVRNETHYTATVTLFNTMDQYISTSGTVETPKIRLEVPILCGYMKSMLISADFNSMGYDMISDVITGSGSFQVTVQLMNGTVPLPYNYSLSPEEAVVVDVSLNTSSEQIKVVINKCWATPTPNPEDTYSHIFLENSCSMNTYTKVLTNGNSSTSRVSVQIFSIVNMNVIYLHCQVQICVQIGEDSCVPDCLQRTLRASRNMIGTAFGSSGPLLKSDEEPFNEQYNTLQIAGLSCLGIGLTLCFMVAFICLFYYQRNRIGHYNFTVRPKQDNFTYLVFNT